MLKVHITSRFKSCNIMQHVRKLSYSLIELILDLILVVNAFISRNCMSTYNFHFNFLN